MKQTNNPFSGGRRYYALDTFLKETYGQNVYKLALDGGMTCPNRDGTLGTSGCIFCSAGGSGDFAADHRLSVSEQINAQILAANNRKTHSATAYIAYFQAYTNTYAPCAVLKELFSEALAHPAVCGLSIATRPDCLPDETIALLASLNRIKPVWIELGLQTIHEETARFINRGYALDCFSDAVERLKKAGISQIIVHTILGLPGETDNMQLSTMRYLNTVGITGIKLQLLHVLKGTKLADLYAAEKFEVLTKEHYIDLVIKSLELLRPDIVIHRLTGDGPKDLLIAPVWSLHKRQLLNELQHQLKTRDTWQGRLYPSASDKTYTKP